MNRLLTLLTLITALLGTAAVAEEANATTPAAVAEPEDEFQPKTLIGDSALSWGGFGSPVIKVTTLGGSSAVLFGGRGAAVLNHTLAIGGGGFGLPGRRQERAFGYGGPTLNVIFFADKLVHFDVGTMVAWGGARLGDLESDVFVLEPEVNLELNVTRNMRVALGASYRHVADVGSATGLGKEFSGLTGSLGIRFGTF